MKASYVAAAFFLVATPTFAGVVSPPNAITWNSVESGVSVIGDVNSTVSTLERRLGNPVVTCYNQGTDADRVALTTAIDTFCNNYLIGQTVSPGHEYWQRFFYGDLNVYVSLTMFTPSPCGSSVVDGACNVNLRMPVDQCNTGGVNGKQGGYMTDACAVWRTNPGWDGSDY